MDECIIQKRWNTRMVHKLNKMGEMVDFQKVPVLINIRRRSIFKQRKNFPKVFLKLCLTVADKCFIFFRVKEKN